jgi:hypothetical protein
MSDDQPWLTTEEQRERAQEARRWGEICGACGRAFEDRETVYIQRLAVRLRPFTGSSPRRSRQVVHWAVPVGAECASAALLARAAERAPERCAGCARPLQYAMERQQRSRATCSSRCVHRADRARREQRKVATDS